MRIAWIASGLMQIVLSSYVVGVAAAGAPLTTIRVANNLSLPLFVTAPPGDYGRIFIVEQRSGTTGRIRIVRLPSHTLEATPFLTIPNLSSGNEQGLLGLAFHPNYGQNGYFYVHYTDADWTSRVVRYTASPPTGDVADPLSAQPVLSLSQPFRTHNGGWMAFGPDNLLYVAFGDGGGQGDPDGRAQDPNDLHGKLLRIQIDADVFPADPERNYAIPPDNPYAGGGGGAEIWARGLRNPWRNSFDRVTGDLYIGDVGQETWEELNFQPAGAGGRNYGWRCWEGNHAFLPTGCEDPGTMVFPIHEYSHTADAFSCSITGGYVYRGCAIPDLRGQYFFADYCSDKIRTLVYVPGVGITGLTDRTSELDPPGGQLITNITSFGEDARGELYLTEFSGDVWKIVPATAPADCNANGVADGCEADDDGDGVIDACECPGDLNDDGLIDLIDLAALLSHYADPSAGPDDGDLDLDGDVDIEDLAALLARYSLSCP